MFILLINSCFGSMDEGNNNNHRGLGDLVENIEEPEIEEEGQQSFFNASQNLFELLENFNANKDELSLEDGRLYEIIADFIRLRVNGEQNIVEYLSEEDRDPGDDDEEKTRKRMLRCLKEIYLFYLSKSQMFPNDGDVNDTEEFAIISNIRNSILNADEVENKELISEIFLMATQIGVDSSFGLNFIKRAQEGNFLTLDEISSKLDAISNVNNKYLLLTLSGLATNLFGELLKGNISDEDFLTYLTRIEENGLDLSIHGALMYLEDILMDRNIFNLPNFQPISDVVKEALKERTNERIINKPFLFEDPALRNAMQNPFLYGFSFHRIIDSDMEGEYRSTKDLLIESSRDEEEAEKHLLYYFTLVLRDRLCSGKIEEVSENYHIATFELLGSIIKTKLGQM